MVFGFGHWLANATGNDRKYIGDQAIVHGAQSLLLLGRKLRLLYRNPALCGFTEGCCKLSGLCLLDERRPAVGHGDLLNQPTYSRTDIKPWLSQCVMGASDDQLTIGIHAAVAPAELSVLSEWPQSDRQFKSCCHDVCYWFVVKCY